MTKETRAGYASIAVLEDMLTDYVKVHTVDRKYCGELYYLDLLKQYRDYLKEESI